MSSSKINVFVFVDALGWDLIENSEFLTDILPHRKPLRMQFGYSSSAIPTILSGKRPAEHGHLGLFRYAPEESPFKAISSTLSFLRPTSFWHRGRIRNWISKFVKLVLGFTGYFQLYNVSDKKLAYMDYCEKKDLFLPKGMEDIPNLADMLIAKKVSHHISDWHLTDAARFEIAMEEIRKGKDFVFLYTCELDALRHQRGAKVQERLAWYAERLKKLHSVLLESGREFSLSIFSDHGMTPLTKTIDIMAAIEKTGLVFGTDYGAFYDSTMFRVNYLKPGVKEKIEDAMGLFVLDGHWLTQEEERAEGIYREDRSFGDRIFLVNPGIQIVPSDMGTSPLNAMHGYSPDDIHSLAMMLSTDPLPDYLVGVWNVFQMMQDKIDASKQN